MAAYIVAFASSGTQYDTSERAETLLPKPAAKIATAYMTLAQPSSSCKVVYQLELTWGKKHARPSKSDA
jgi:hypothetical protein